jgi:hypothetical protein
MGQIATIDDHNRKPRNSQLHGRIGLLPAANVYRGIRPSTAGHLPMLALGIETSCDETGLAVYDTGRGLLAHALHSQVAMHAIYGGVVPELASRDHVRRVVPLASAYWATPASRWPNSTASPSRGVRASRARFWSAPALQARSAMR